MGKGTRGVWVTSVVDARAKGLRTQRILRKLLEGQGYLVYMVAHARHSADIFSLWDGFSLRRGEFFFTQVKTNATGLERKTRPHREFCERYGINGRVYNWLEGRGLWQVLEYPQWPDTEKGFKQTARLYEHG